MATVHGIPAGGLFNEIYDAHLKRQTTYTDHNPPSSELEQLLTANSSDIGNPYQPATITRTKYAYVDVSKEYGGITWLGHLFSSLCAMLVYILFVVGPVGASTNPGPLGALVLYSSALGVWIGVYFLLKYRWKKKVSSLEPELVGVPDGTETITERISFNEEENSFYHADNSQNTAHSMYPSLKIDKKWVDRDELKDQIRHLKNYMNSTGKVPDWVNKDVAGFEKIFGAACEITTARDMASLNVGDVYNDVVLRNSDGSVSANIDHLLSLGTSTIMVDSKWWSASPEFVTDRQDRRMVSATGPHARAVSTCIYEASFLPRNPRAIIFCVRGKAARELGSPQVVDSYNKFVPYEDKSQCVLATQYPLTFSP